MATNPNPEYITDASWWFMEQLLALEPRTENAGIYANKSGYHNTGTANEKYWPGNYSIVDDEDRRGPDWRTKAAAYDWTFPEAQSGDYRRIAKYTSRLLASAKDLNDPRLNGWREFYGNADLDNEVEGWDTRYGYPASSDSSHLWHIHMSESREFVHDLDNKKAMLSVLRGDTVAQWKSGGEETLFCKYGDHSPQVWVLQSDLNNAGFPVALDWIYGDQTAAALVKAGVCGADKTGRTYSAGEYAGLQRILRHKDAREIVSQMLANLPVGPQGPAGPPGPAGPVTGARLVVTVEEVQQ